MKKFLIQFNTQYFIIGVIIICSFLNSIECEKNQLKQFALEQKETNTPNFIRLVVMRLIFGLAASMGYGDRLAGFLGGIFVPPGADYDDYDGDIFAIDDTSRKSNELQENEHGNCDNPREFSCDAPQSEASYVPASCYVSLIFRLVPYNILCNPCFEKFTLSHLIEQTKKIMPLVKFI